MRAKPVVIAAFAISTAVAAVAMLQKGDTAVPREQILASSMDLTAGTLLRAQDITWRSVPVAEPDQIGRQPGAAAQAKPEIVEETAAIVHGAVLRHPLASGAPIRRGDFVKPGDRDF